MILVTGATGHIGNVLARELLARGEQVRALILPGERCSSLEGLRIECVEGDVLDPLSLEKAFQGVDVVYHLAGIITIMPGKNELVTRVNYQGTVNMLKAARAAGVKRLVYTSSIHAFARVEGVVIDECIPLDPHNPEGEYDRSKAQATQAVLQACQDGLDAVIVCPTGVIGPHDYFHSEMGRLVTMGMKGGLQFYLDGGYDFVDVRDVAQGLLLAREKGRCGEIYILSGEGITVLRLMQLIRQFSGRRSWLVKIPLWLARFGARFTPLLARLNGSRPIYTTYSLATVTSNYNIRCDKARRELGFAPRPIEESLADAVRWFQENRQVWTGSR